MICPHCNKPIPTVISTEQRRKILQLHKQGYSLRDIQQLTGVSFSTAGRIVREKKKLTQDGERKLNSEGDE